MWLASGTLLNNIKEIKNILQLLFPMDHWGKP